MKLKMGLFFSVFLCIAIFSNLCAQKVTDLLSLPAINYNATHYTLQNAYQPNDNHYKQVYFSGNENSHHFSSMVQVEVVYGQDSLRNLFQYKLNELEALKKSDPVCDYSYEINSKTGEYFLCYLSSVQKNKNTDIVEWNAFRYKPVPTNNGSIGVMLFTVTKRAYKRECPAFLEDAKSKKSTWMNDLMSFAMPEFRAIQ